MARTIPAVFPGRNPAMLPPRAPIETSDAVDVIEGTNYAAAYDVPAHWSTEHSILSRLGVQTWPIVETGFAGYVTHLAIPITTGLVAGAGLVAVSVFLEALVAGQTFTARMAVYTGADGAGALVGTATTVLAIAAKSQGTITYDGLDPDTDYRIHVALVGAAAGGSCTLYRTACWVVDRAVADLPG